MVPRCAPRQLAFAMRMAMLSDTVKTTRRVLFVGLHPDFVDYSKWAGIGLTREKLFAGLEEQVKTIQEMAPDIEAVGCWIDTGDTAEEVLSNELAKGADCVLVGAGVRTDPDHFLLFEKLINVVHKSAPEASICFNTQPSDSISAVSRWLNK